VLENRGLSLKVVRLQFQKAYFDTTLSGGMQFLDSSALFTIGSAILTMIGWAFLLWKLNWGLGDFIDKLVSVTMKKLTFSEMGKASGDSRFRGMVESKTKDAMIDFMPKVLNNPILEMGIEYILNETELGDILREDPRALPIALGYLNKMVAEGVDIDKILGGLGGLGSAEPKTTGGYE